MDLRDYDEDMRCTKPTTSRLTSSTDRLEPDSDQPLGNDLDMHDEERMLFIYLLHRASIIDGSAAILI